MIKYGIFSYSAAISLTYTELALHTIPTHGTPAALS